MSHHAQASNTQLFEAIALSGQHFAKCGGCGTVLCSPDSEVITNLVQEHACTWPQSTLDMLTDRLVSVGGLIALILISTAAFAMWRLTCLHLI